MKTKFVFLVAMLALVMSCKPAAKEIGYGKDQCHFCKMTIVDKAHAALLVTKKGKQYNYDAIECMVREYNRQQLAPEAAIMQVADYNHPGHMLDARTAVYVITPAIKSPMGANLSAVADQQAADDLLTSHRGESLHWDQLLNRFK